MLHTMRVRGPKYVRVPQAYAKTVAQVRAEDVALPEARA